MITFLRYREFLSELSKDGILSIPVDRLINRTANGFLLVIKHDVETKIHLALKLAHLEAEYGHFSTYYFQGDLLFSAGAAEIVKEIAELGHEVAYHYDVLDSHNGDYAAAKQEFDRYREKVEALTCKPLRTVCPHGNPTKVRDGWRSNKDFFRSQGIREAYPEIHDIVVDFTSLLPRGIYLSDAGFKLRRIGNISGNDVSNEAAINDGTMMDWTDVRTLVTAGNSVVLSVHPHRLRDSELLITLLRARMTILRSGYRVAERVPFLKIIASKLYAQARRF